jgi:hypothetical protein
VDLLHIIQLGVAFADSSGEFAPGCPCWQFNFSFSLASDMFAQDSIDLLVKSGISFEDHESRGIGEGERAPRTTNARRPAPVRPDPSPPSPPPPPHPPTQTPSALVS